MRIAKFAVKSLEIISPMSTIIKWIKRCWHEYSILLLIAALQILPPLLRLIPCLKDNEWLIVVFNVLIIVLVIFFREIRRIKLSKESNEKIAQNAADIKKISGDTIDLSALTVTVAGEVESLGTLLNSMYKEIQQLKRQNGFRTGRL